MKENKDRLKITEIFMAKCGEKGWDRCFHGTIKRLKDENDIPYVFSRIKVNNGFICSRASCQWELGDRLDIIVKMVLDEGLHASAGKTVDIAGTVFFLN